MGKAKRIKEQKKEEVESTLIALIDSARNGFEKYKDQFIELEKGYLASMSSEQLKSLQARKKSSLMIQLIAPKVNTITRETMKNFFENDKLAEIIPDELKDQNAVAISEILKDELKRYSQFEKLYMNTKLTVLNTLIYGTAVLKVYWSSALNKCRLENVRLSDVWFDPDAGSADDIKYLVHRIKGKTVAELKQNHPNATIDWDELSQIQDTNTTGDVGEYTRVEIREVYRKQNNKWYVSTLTETDEFIRVDEELKDGLPFIISRVLPQFVTMEETPVRAYGGSYIEHFISLQTEYNIRRNQQIDAINRQLDPRIVTTKNSGISEADLLSNKKKLEVDDINNFKVFDTPSINEAIFDTDKIEGEIQEVSGMPKYTQGLNDKANLNQTATGIRYLTSQSNSTIDDNNRGFNETLFRPLFTRIVMLTYKYHEDERWADVDRSQELKQKILINAGAGSANREIRLENIQQAIDSLLMQYQLYAQIGDQKGLQSAITSIEKLNDEKLALLGVNTILERKEQEDELQEQMMQEQYPPQEQYPEEMMMQEQIPPQEGDFR